jgi:hypothetical protein
MRCGIVAYLVAFQDQCERAMVGHGPAITDSGWVLLLEQLPHSTVVAATQCCTSSLLLLLEHLFKMLAVTAAQCHIAHATSMLRSAGASSATVRSNPHLCFSN